MSYILNIETATEVCSVAISRNNEIIYYREETKGPSHAVLLGVFVNDAINEMRAKDIKLDAVAVSCGPGSYTGLRIGVSEAKGLCYGLNIPLIAINTLKIMAQGIIENNTIENNSILCSMIDARRMEVYDLLLDRDLNEIRPTSADIIDENSFSDILKEKQIVFFGNGAAKCKEVLPKQKTTFIDGIYPKASDMVKLANEAYAKQDFVDVAYFEPFYLKEFVATTPKNKVLGEL